MGMIVLNPKVEAELSNDLKLKEHQALEIEKVC